MGFSFWVFGLCARTRYLRDTLRTTVTQTPLVRYQRRWRYSQTPCTINRAFNQHLSSPEPPNKQSHHLLLAPRPPDSTAFTYSSCAVSQRKLFVILINDIIVVLSKVYQANNKSFAQPTHRIPYRLRQSMCMRHIPCGTGRTHITQRTSDIWIHKIITSQRDISIL